MYCQEIKYKMDDERMASIMSVNKNQMKTQIILQPVMCDGHCMKTQGDCDKRRSGYPNMGPSGAPYPGPYPTGSSNRCTPDTVIISDKIRSVYLMLSV